MKTKWFLLLCSLLLWVNCITGCTEEKDDGKGYLFTYTMTGNPECLDPQYTDNQNAQIVIEQIMEGLLRMDETGRILPAGAESYTVSDDGLHYQFKLRNDCYWFSAGTEEKNAKPVTSLDYVFAFQRLLSPETDSPHAEEYFCLKNASAVHNGDKKPEELGISVLDGGTLCFDLEYPDSDFLYLLTQSCAVPCNKDFFESTNGRYGLDEKSVLCNGAFCLNKWAYDAYGSGNFITLRKNSTYYDREQICPESLQFTIMRNQQETDEDFSQGNCDVILTDSYPVNYLNSEKYVVKSSCTQTIGLIFNPENEILKQTDFRKALAYGINRESYSSVLNGNLQPASGIIPPAVQMLGRPYRELYADEPLCVSYSPEQAISLFDKSCSSVSVSDINALKILIPQSFPDTSAMLAICQEWQELSGHYLGIESVSDSEYRKRLQSGEYSIALYTFHTPRNSCHAALQNIASKADLLGMNTEKLCSLLDSISNSEQTADLIALYGQAEQEIIDSYAFIPLFYCNLYLIYTSDNTDIFPRPFTHSIDFRKAKHFA